LANAYGPRNVSGPLPTFFQRLTEGKPCFVMDTRRDFIYVQDLIDLVVRALDGQGSGGAYHASSGSDYSIKELYDATVAAPALDPAPRRVCWWSTTYSRLSARTCPTTGASRSLRGRSPTTGCSRSSTTSSTTSSTWPRTTATRARWRTRSPTTSTT